jgi:hypothetical protein
MNHITFNPQLSGVALLSTKLNLTAELNMVQDTLLQNFMENTS